MSTPRLAEVLEVGKRATAANYVLTETGITVGQVYRGKVRDCFIIDDIIVLVTCDRLSAFDRNIANIPFKGAVLNGVSSWWFQQTASIVPNHIIAVPHPNVVIARRTRPFAVEVVVRAYLTGSTSTSIWVHYSKGVRNYCGNALPDGESPLP
jgi:phosphoribosylaminoimidazole-succinocarboxamide synthase